MLRKYLFNEGMGSALRLSLQPSSHPGPSPPSTLRKHPESLRESCLLPHNHAAGTAGDSHSAARVHISHAEPHLTAPPKARFPDAASYRAALGLTSLLPHTTPVSIPAASLGKTSLFQVEGRSRVPRTGSQ